MSQRAPIGRPIIAFPIEGGDSAYFNYFLNLVDSGAGKEQVKAFIRIVEIEAGKSFRAFNLWKLYEGLKSLVRRGKLRIEYVFLLRSSKSLENPAAREFLGRYTTFSERVGVTFADGGLLEASSIAQSVVLLSKRKVAFTHGRGPDGRIVNPLLWIFPEDYKRLSKAYETVYFQSTEYSPESYQPQAVSEVDVLQAVEIQKKLLPQEGFKIGNWKTYYHYEAAGRLSGDYIDLIPSDSQLFFVLGDVSGKGLGAAMIMTQLHTLFHGSAPLQLQLGDLVRRANDLLLKDAPAGLLVTLVCGRANTEGRLEIHNAGHPAPLLLRRNKEVQTFPADDPPLGVEGGRGYKVTEVQLEPGETLVLYTDGISEACDRRNRQYGSNRLSKCLREVAQKETSALVEACIADLLNFTGAESAKKDDVTLLALRRA